MFIACMSFKNTSTIMLSSDFFVSYLVTADITASFIEDYMNFSPSAKAGQESSP